MYVATQPHPLPSPVILTRMSRPQVQLLGDVGKSVHDSLPLDVRARLIYPESSSRPLVHELTPPPPRPQRSAPAPTRLGYANPAANLPSLGRILELNNNFNGMAVKAAAIDGKGTGVVAQRRLSAGIEVAYYLVKVYSNNSSHQWSDCAISVSKTETGDVFATNDPKRGSCQRPDIGGLPYIGHLVNEPCLAAGETVCVGLECAATVPASHAPAHHLDLPSPQVNARMVFAPPHPVGQRRFAIETTDVVPRGRELLVDYGPLYRRSWPSVHG